MPLDVFLIGLVVQIVIWPILYVLVIAYDRWRRRRAEAQGKRVGHFNEVVVVLALISLLAWIGGYLVGLVRAQQGG